MKKTYYINYNFYMNYSSNIKIGSIIFTNKINTETAFSLYIK